MREIVTTLRLPVELVRKLHEAWVKMGSMGDMVLRIEDSRVALALFRTVHGTRRAITSDARNLGRIEAVNASSVDGRMKRASNLEPPDGRPGSADQLRACGTGQPTGGMIPVFEVRNFR